MSAHPIQHTTNKAMRVVIREAIERGWAVAVSSGGHLKMSREGCATVYAPCTPRNDYSATRTRSMLRRAEAQERRQ